MKKGLFFTCILLVAFISKINGQTNISLLDLTLINGEPTMNFGIEKQFNRYQATVLIPYSDPLYTENKDAGAKRFFNARIGYFVFATEGASRVRTRTGAEIVDARPVVGGTRVTYREKKFSVELTPGFAILCGLDYYQTFVERNEKTNLVAADNLTVGSIFSKFYYTSSGKGATSRYFIDLSYGIFMNLANPVNKNTDLKRLALRLGVDLYVFDFMSTKICVGKVPGINGKNGWATLVNIGFPLKY